jgi:S-DNA-T family DNA segregation ATPase FtsK/SpoIIIE
VPLIVGGVTLLSLCNVLDSNLLKFGPGGWVGLIIAQQMEASFNLLGAFIVSLSLFCVGLSLVFSVNWLLVCEWIGFYTVNLILQKGLMAPKILYQKIKSGIDHVMAMLKVRRERNQTKKLAASTPPTIVRAELSTDAKAPKVAAESDPLPVIKPTTVEAAKEESNSQVVINEQHKPNVKKVKKSFANFSKGRFPSLGLLQKINKSDRKGLNNKELELVSRDVEQRLLDFGVDVQVVAVHPGPVITRFELKLAPGIKVSKISGLAKDLARSLSVNSVRVVEVIPGKSVVGLELPNLHREMVGLQEVLSSEKFQETTNPLSLALGVDISGFPMFVNLAKMPHLLVAGTTGSGKSVGINAMILSLLFKSTPEEVRLILVDPKMLELSVYEGIPHLLTPVVTDMKDAANALRWSVAEMEKRYRLMASLGVRNISGYNKKVRDAQADGAPLVCPLTPASPTGEPEFLETLPYIVIIIDELADMMMVVGKKVEQLIARIAQKARAAGIHLILATQRPSVDVLTGLIKSNIPTRVSYQVSSKIDSRTILDQQGAEQLLGQGDLLYLAPGTGTPIRVHGAFVDDKEVHRVVDAWKKLGEPDYIDGVTTQAEESGLTNANGEVEETDPIYDEAVSFVCKTRKASISSVQRRFKIGYNRAARLVEEMERTGVVGPMENGGMREVLAPVPVEDES